MDDMDFDEGLVGEAPCEFCGELYPLMLLIEHQTTHLAEDENYAYLDEFQNPGLAENIIQEEIAELKSEPKVAVEQNQTSPPELIEIEVSSEKSSHPKNENELSSVSSKTRKAESSVIKNETEIPAEGTKIGQTQNLTIKDELKGHKIFQTQNIKVFTSESGEKLLVYGNDMDPEKDMESEKQMYKMPNNPLFSNVCKEEDVEDINNLSDDDCDESLEEFWKRARDFLKRKRVKSEC